MSSKTDVTYILQHIPSGFYAKASYGDLELTENITKAKQFEPNETKSAVMWSKLISSDSFKVIKRTETTSTSYEEVEL